jgi:electron transfer flavoprotein beta subunit
MGPPSFNMTIREAIELGADRGVLLSDRKFAGADTLATSYVLATAIEAIQEEDPIDLFFFGKQAIDGDTAQVGPGVAVRLGIPIITYAVKIREIDVEGHRVFVERRTERWTEIVETPMPALLTCEKEIAEIPYAPLPDLIRSLKYDPEMWTMDGPIEFERKKVGVLGSPTMVNRTATPPQPEPGDKINARDIGAEAAVADVLERADKAGVLEAALGQNNASETGGDA